jgi:WD40 repeat protein
MPDLERVLADYLHAVEAGAAPDRVALLQKYPELAADLQSFFRNRDAMERIAEPIKEQVPEPVTIGPASTDIPVGTFVRYFGDYELLQEIARGGMGVVWKARQTSLNRIVALKMILAGQLASAADVARFHSEAEAASHLDHPNIVPIYEIGEHEGQHYFSMKLVEGGSLASRGRQPSEQAARLLVTVARAVHHAHQRGILHRDLKPGNILIDAEGQPHVTDFGLAKRQGELGSATGDRGLTVTGAIVGTPAYMSPEQARAEKQLTTAVDIYSLGAILFEMLTGRPPFVAQSPLDTVLQLLEQEPPAPRSIYHDVDRDLETICLKCLNKDPQRRYDSAAALADDLQRWLGGEPILARPVGTGERLVKWVRRRPATAALIAVSVLAVLVLFASGFYFNVQLQEQVERAEKGEAAAIESAKNEATERRRADREADAAWAHQYAAHANLLASDWESANLGRIFDTLEIYRKPPAGRKDLRGWEWYYQERLCHQDIRPLKGHKGIVLNVAFNPDGTRLATAGNDGTLNIWDAATGEILRIFKTDGAAVGSVAYTPDGTQVAAAMYDTVKLFDGATGQEVRGFKTPAIMVSSIAFSPDGTRLATAGLTDLTVRLWDVATGKQLRAFDKHEFMLYGVAFSPDGTKIASADLAGSVKLWDAETGKEIHDFKADLLPKGGPGNLGIDVSKLHAATSVSFSPDGSLLAAACSDGMVRVWEVDSGKVVRGYRGPAPTQSAVYSPDGTRLASAHGDGTVRLWDTATGDELRTIKGHTAAVHTVAFSPDGARLASGGFDGMAKICDISAGQSVRTLKTKAATPDTDFATVASVAISPDGTRIAAGCWDTSVLLWDTMTGQRVQAFYHSKGSVNGVAFSPDGKQLAAVAADESVLLWDTAIGKEARVLQGRGFPMGGYSSVAYSPDGGILAAASESNACVDLWDPRSGAKLHTMNSTGRGQVLSVAFSLDGTQLATAGQTAIVEVWNIASLKEPMPSFLMLETTSAVAGVAFGPGGKHLATANRDHTIQVWDLGARKVVHTLKGHVGPVNGVAFSSDGMRLASASDDGTVKLWDTVTGQELRTFKVHTGRVTSVAFNRDGSWLASAGRDSTVRLWDARPLSPAVQAERDAVLLLETLFAKPLPASAVRAVVQKQALLSPAARQKALDILDRPAPLWDNLHADPPKSMAERLARYDDFGNPADTFYAAAWQVLRHPNANRFVTEIAVLQMKAADQWAPDHDKYRSALGIAYYRLGKFEKEKYQDALTLLEMCKQKEARTVAFLAMTQHRLDRKGGAQATLERLRELLKRPEWSGDPEGHALLAEAEATCKR